MSVIIVLVIIGVVVAGGFLGAFIWSVKSGQYDDTYSPAVRMLFDDTHPVDTPIEERNKEKPEKTKTKK
jgi:cbb3-type cytochrome oxidase maturation protein